MIKRNEDLIEPIRTRGSIRVRGGASGEGENVIPRPIRTCGTVRTRGTAAVPAQTLKVERSLTLDNLVRYVRQEVGDLPLTVFVHGWGSQPAWAFLSMLCPLLRKEDALWLIPTKEIPIPPPPSEVEGAVILDVSRETDQRTYRNLVCAIVFFSALEAAEAGQVAEWQQRARAVIADGQGPQGNAVLGAGCEAGLMTYRWSGKMGFEEYTLS
jgi:hypothetical protein